MKQSGIKPKKTSQKKKKAVFDRNTQKEESITLDKLIEEREKNKSSTDFDEDDEDFVTVKSFKKSLGNSDIYTEDDDKFKHTKKSLPIRSSIAIDDDEKYKGKVIKAKDILGDDKDKEEIDEDLVNILDEHLHKTLEEDDDESDEENEQKEEKEEEDDDDDLMNELDQIEEEDHDIVLMKKDDKESMKDKANSVNNQLKVYDNILTVRIHLQKVVSELNKMTINDENFEQKDEKTIYSTLYSSLKNEIDLNKLLFQKTTTKQPIEIEEINEDSDEMSLDEIWDNLNNEWCEWKSYRDSTIESISNKVQESRGNISKQHQQYKTFNQNPINQINDILKDKERLLKRCQLYRLEQTNLKHNTKELSLSNHTIRNENIYDDNDFYQQQLKELILNRKNLDVNSSNNLLKLKMRHHTKKTNIDRKASKGRKLRFQVHPKIVNFCGPVPYPPCELDKEQLFSSLFGRIPSQTNNDFGNEGNEEEE